MQTVARMCLPMIAAVTAALPRNEHVADQFDLLADLMELDGADSFRISAYRKAAQRIRETPGPVAQMALDGRAKGLQGIGKTIEGKIVEIVEDGEIHALTKKKATVPSELAAFMRLPGLGPKTARRIWEELGITTVAGLRAAAEAQQLRGLSGLGARSEEKILAALAKPAAEEGPRRALLGTTLPKLRAVVDVLAEHPAADKVSVAGSARRYRETVRDLDIIATASDPSALIDHFCSLRWVVEVAARGTTKATVLSHEGLRFDLRVVPPESYGNLLQHFTGSKAHNVALREAAVRRGLSVSEYGITEVESEQLHAFADEEEVYAFLGYDWIPPEMREGLGELELARRAELPDLADEDLATRDWVVASVHHGFDTDPTPRVLAAMDNPYVDCIGHVTNRKINKRAPSAIDIERVVEKALETGTFLEINSQPDRLDLTDVHARAAREAGLKVVIDSDGHEVGALDFVEFGIGQARRAWLSKDDVLNTRPWREVERLRKRRS